MRAILALLTLTIGLSLAATEADARSRGGDVSGNSGKSERGEKSVAEGASKDATRSAQKAWKAFLDCMCQSKYNSFVNDYADGTTNVDWSKGFKDLGEVSPTVDDVDDGPEVGPENSDNTGTPGVDYGGTSAGSLY